MCGLENTGGPVYPASMLAADYPVAPNPLVAGFHSRHTLSAVLHSWKSYTATRANRILNRTGQPFWQKESFDHLIRDDEDRARCHRYIEANPVTARL